MKKKGKCFYVVILAVLFVSIVTVSYSIELEYEFYDQKYGYSIQYPSSWSAGEYRSGIILSEVNSNDKKSGLQIRFQRSSQNIEKFVDNYNVSFKKQMQASLLSERAITIDQLRGYEISFKSNRSGKNYFLKSYILTKDNNSGYYIFQAGTPYKNKSQIEPVLDKIANSFRTQ